MDKVSYALGISVAQNLMRSGVSSLNIDDFKSGIEDTITGKDTHIQLDEASKVLEKYFNDLKKEEMKKSQKQKEENKELEKNYLDTNAKRDEIVVTKSGLQYQVIKEGTGKQPSAHSRVQCHYEGTFISGEKFDSSYDRGTPATFGLDQVIPGWTEGLQLMKEGGVYIFYIPYELGYGENGMPGAIPPCSTLVFKVELIKVL